MAQLRHHYAEYQAREAEILCVGPDDAEAFRRYWEKEKIPFPGLADPKHVVADRYGQQVSLIRLGRMPALMVIDRAGRIRYRHYADSMKDIPLNRTVFEVLDELIQEQAAA